jgi:hypothetical protein
MPKLPSVASAAAGRVSRPDLGLDVALVGMCIASLGAAATGLATSELGYAGAEVPSGPVLCPFRLATGVPCPLCGLTRSLFLAGQGLWGASVDFNVLGPLVLMTAAILLPLSVVGIVRGKPLRWPRPTLAMVGVVITGGWMLNLAPGGP